MSGPLPNLANLALISSGDRSSDAGPPQPAGPPTPERCRQSGERPRPNESEDSPFEGPATKAAASGADKIPPLEGAQDATSLSVRERWLSACGTRPTFLPWKSLSAKNKHQLLHQVAEMADDDELPDGGYLSVYGETDIDDLSPRMRTVEHVVPRSWIRGARGSPGEDDPLGWVEATRSSNSRRSNHPLYLWPDPDNMIALPNTLVIVDGDVHYVPPMTQRARLARKWLFVRATYSEIMPPSRAQRNRAAQIVALAQHYPIQLAERRVNDHYRSSMGWANPLLEDNANEWYENPGWRALIY